MIFEQPLNEHVRACLRLESLFRAIDEFLATPESVWASKACIEHINHVVELLDRSDLRKKFAQELNRLIAYLNRIKETPDINKQAIDSIIDNLASGFSQLEKSNDKFAHSLRTNEFLAQIRHYQSIPGGVSLINCPALHVWLTQPAAERHTHIRHWVSELQDIYDVSMVILDLLRKSAAPRLQKAMNGFTQIKLDSTQNCQLIRIELLDPIPGLYPQISASRHGISVRFHQLDIHGNMRQLCEKNIEFNLMCCVI